MSQFERLGLLMLNKNRSLLLISCVLIFAIVGCSVQPHKSIQPTPTLAETLSQRDAIRHMRSHVIQQVQIVDPFQVTVIQAEGKGEVFAVSYVTPYPFGGDLFEEELKNVALQASEGFVRAEPRLPSLMISATSVDQQSGSRMIAIEFDAAYQWFTEQIDTEAYVGEWVLVQ